MPLYYDWHLVGAFVGTAAWMWLLAHYDGDWPSSWMYWLLLAISYSISCGCSGRLLRIFWDEWREPPDVQLNNAAAANGNAAQLQRGRLQHLPGSPRMLADVLQCLPRAGLDACQLVSKQFRDAVEDARMTLPLFPMDVSLRPTILLVEYVASIADVGTVAGHFFTGLRRCDSPYFRNAAISLLVDYVTYARTSTDMMHAFVRWLNLDERNIRFTDLQCEAYADELKNLFRFVDRHDIASVRVIYKRSLVTPGCDFVSTLFAEARKRQLSWLTVSLSSAQAKNGDMELQVGFQMLSEIFQDQEHPAAEHLTVIVPRLNGFHLLRRIYQAYARGEITRPLTIGCHASVPLAELWPENCVLVGEELSPPNGYADGRGRVTAKLITSGETIFYRFSLPC